MIRQILFSAALGALSISAMAQVATPGDNASQGMVSAIEAGRDNSVNGQSVADEQAHRVTDSGTMAAPTDADRAKILVPLMEIPGWQSSAGAAQGASNAAKGASMPRATVDLSSPGAQRELQDESKP